VIVESLLPLNAKDSPYSPDIVHFFVGLTTLTAYLGKTFSIHCVALHTHCEPCVNSSGGMQWKQEKGPIILPFQKQEQGEKIFWSDKVLDSPSCSAVRHLKQA